jgi:hypothetical protein
MKKILFSAVVALSAAVFAEPAEKKSFPTPLEINLTSPLQLMWGERDVYGLRANLLYGDGYDVFGLDLGFVGVNTGVIGGLQANAFNWTDGAVGGLQIGGVVNYVSQDAAGLQLAGFLSLNRGKMTGLQISPISMNAGFTGLQLGGLNWTDGAVDYAWSSALVNKAGDFSGFQLGAFNLAETVSGAQLGAFNVTFGSVKGAQYGVFNLAENLNGVQLGLVNMVAKGKIPVTLLFNIGF